VSQDRLIPVALRDAIGDLWELAVCRKSQIFQTKIILM
jgi:hypothetical protein